MLWIGLSIGLIVGANISLILYACIIAGKERDSFVKIKYFQKRSKDEIKQALKFDSKKQKIIKDKLIEFVYKNAKIRNLV